MAVALARAVERHEQHVGRRARASTAAESVRPSSASQSRAGQRVERRTCGARTHAPRPAQRPQHLVAHVVGDEPVGAARSARGSAGCRESPRYSGGEGERHGPALGPLQQRVERRRRSSWWPASASSSTASVRVIARSRGPSSVTSLLGAQPRERQRQLAARGERQPAPRGGSVVGDRRERVRRVAAAERVGVVERRARRPRRRRPRRRRRARGARASRAGRRRRARRASPTRTGARRAWPTRAAASSCRSRRARRGRRAAARRGPRAAGRARGGGPRRTRAATARSTCGTTGRGDRAMAARGHVREAPAAGCRGAARAPDQRVAAAAHEGGPVPPDAVPTPVEIGASPGSDDARRRAARLRSRRVPMVRPCTASATDAAALRPTRSCSAIRWCSANRIRAWMTAVAGPDPLRMQAPTEPLRARPRAAGRRRRGRACTARPAQLRVARPRRTPGRPHRARDARALLRAHARRPVDERVRLGRRAHDRDGPRHLRHRRAARGAAGRSRPARRRSARRRGSSGSRGHAGRRRLRPKRARSRTRSRLSRSPGGTRRRPWRRRHGPRAARRPGRADGRADVLLRARRLMRDNPPRLEDRAIVDRMAPPRAARGRGDLGWRRLRLGPRVAEGAGPRARARPGRGRVAARGARRRLAHPLPSSVSTARTTSPAPPRRAPASSPARRPTSCRCWCGPTRTAAR